MEPLYQVGDVVLLNDSCEEDIGPFAWNYIKDHRVAGVIGIRASKNGVMYSLLWPETFDGGHSCWKTGPAGQCQFVSEKHLELENFEAAFGAAGRDVITIPHIEGYDGDETKENSL